MYVNSHLSSSSPPYPRRFAPPLQRLQCGRGFAQGRARVARSTIAWASGGQYRQSHSAAGLIFKCYNSNGKTSTSFRVATCAPTTSSSCRRSASASWSTWQRTLRPLLGWGNLMPQYGGDSSFPRFTLTLRSYLCSRQIILPFFIPINSYNS